MGGYSLICILLLLMVMVGEVTAICMEDLLCHCCALPLDFIMIQHPTLAAGMIPRLSLFIGSGKCDKKLFDERRVLCQLVSL